MDYHSRISIALQACVAWITGVLTAVALLAVLCLLGSCATVHGICSDAEVAAREIKQVMRPYANQNDQGPRIVYVAKNEEGSDPK